MTEKHIQWESLLAKQMLISFEFVVFYWEKYSFLQIWADILFIVDIEKKMTKNSWQEKKKSMADRKRNAWKMLLIFYTFIRNRVRPLCTKSCNGISHKNTADY